MENSLKKRHYLVSIVAICGVALMCYPFSDWLGYRSIALILLLVVSVLGMRLSLKPVLLAAVLGAFIWDFFFIPPKFTFTVGSEEDVLLLVMYFIVALSNGVFNYKLRQYEHLARQKEEKESAIKLYNTLFDSLSHELRTPIATMLGATDALLEDNAKISDKDRRELISEVSNAAVRLNYQVENLLNVSRLDSGFIKPNFEWCDVSELVYSVINKSEKILFGHIIEVDIPENMPLVKLDFGLTEQVLNNIIKNAVIYTPENTIINIQAGMITDKSGHFDDADNNTVDEVTHKLYLSVRDSGKGFSADEIDRIFDKFYRIKDSKTGGTGLGLYIVKGFIEAQGGTVLVANNTKGGADFNIEIPTAVLAQNLHHEIV